MTWIAPGGTRKSTGAPRARRSRNAVEDTSIRGIVTGRTSQPMSGSSAVSVARASTATVTASRNSPPASRYRAPPRRRHRRSGRGPDRAAASVRDRVDRVRRARAVELESSKLRSRRRRRAPPRPSRSAHLGRRDHLPALLPRIAGDDEEHAVEAELVRAPRPRPTNGRRAPDRTCLRRHRSARRVTAHAESREECDCFLTVR